MTPFEKAGYTHETRFKVLMGGEELVEGDIVKLLNDYGNIAPFFITEDGRRDCLLLPGEARKVGEKEELEVCDEEQLKIKATWSNKELHEKMLGIIDEIVKGVESPAYYREELTQYYQGWRQDIIDTFKLDEERTK